MIEIIKIKYHKFILNYMIKHNYSYQQILKQSQTLDIYIAKLMKLQIEQVEQKKRI